MSLESAVPGAYQQMCMQLPERTISLKVRYLILSSSSISIIELNTYNIPS